MRRGAFASAYDEALGFQTGFHFLGSFGVKDHNGHGGIAVEGQVGVVHVDVALDQGGQQCVQGAGLVLGLHGDHIRQTAEIAFFGQLPGSLDGIGHHHADDAVLGTVVGDGSPDIDALLKQGGSNDLQSAFFIFGVNG